MVARLVLWSIGDSDVTIAELRRDLRDASGDRLSSAPGLLFQAWVSDEASERFGSIEIWASREASEDPIALPAGASIGRDPQVVEIFDLEATVSVEPQLARLGLAFA